MLFQAGSITPEVPGLLCVYSNMSAEKQCTQNLKYVYLLAFTGGKLLLKGSRNGLSLLFMLEVFTACPNHTWSFPSGLSLPFHDPLLFLCIAKVAFSFLQVPALQITPKTWPMLSSASQEGRMARGHLVPLAWMVGNT